MDYNTGVIALFVLLGVLAFLAIILLLIKIGILGSSDNNDNSNGRVKNNDGKNIYQQYNSGNGLAGYGEDRSDTIVMGSMNKIWKIELVNISTNQRYFASLEDRLLIGRSNNGVERKKFIGLDDKENMISSNHAELISSRGGVMLRDLNSVNHTWVNRKRINETINVYSGDVLRLATSEFYIYIE